MFPLRPLFGRGKTGMPFLGRVGGQKERWGKASPARMARRIVLRVGVDGGLVQFAREETFQFFSRKFQMELSFESNGDAARFFRHDDGQRVGLLRHAEGGAVAQSELFGDVQAVRHGQDAAGGRDALVGDNHGPVVERAVFEEDVFDEALVEVRVDGVARVDDVVERDAAFKHDECAHFLLAHVQAGHYDGHDVRPLHLCFLRAREQMEEAVHLLVGAKCLQEPADVVLEQHDERDGSHLDQLVEDGPQQPHFQDLRHEQPQQDEDEHSGENLHRAGLLHELVGVVEQEGDGEYVDDIFDFDGKHHSVCL